jgi:formylglycine-generating enzyme required for sulfatase activity
MEPYAVTTHRFAAFVAATAYVTEAERDGWSFVFAGRLRDGFAPTRALASAPWRRAVPGASWRAPDGPDSLARPDHPVVHVSHADALAFCAWAGVCLPSDDECTSPHDLGLHNVVGNVWEWTAERMIRGGSYLCHPSYCNRNQLSGRSEGEAPMGHIGFRVVSAEWRNGSSVTLV